MEYFHLGIFGIPRVYLVRKYGYQTQAFFFVFHRFFDTVCLRSINQNCQGFKVAKAVKAVKVSIVKIF